MMHTIEPAASSRAKCRGCGRSIEKGVLRFGERLPNPFAEGTDMTHWFHTLCAAMKRPEPFLKTIEFAEFANLLEDLDALRAIAELGVVHRRVPRIDGAERSPSRRATCRYCREPIEKETWRIQLVFYEAGMFNPAGYIHVGCAEAYFGTGDVVDRIANFSPDLTEQDLKDLRSLIAKC